MRFRFLPKILLYPAVLCILHTGCAKRLTLEDFPAQYERVRNRYETRLAEDPKNDTLRFRLAEFYYRLKDYERIPPLLKKSTLPQAQILLAKTWVQLKEYDHALALFDTLQAQPLAADAIAGASGFYYFYGLVLEKKNLFPKAKTMYEKASGTFAPQAQERIRKLITTIDTSVPAHIAELTEAAAAFAEAMKDEAALVYLIDEEIEITPQNTSVMTIHIIEKVLQERGKSLAEVEIGYDSTYERVEVVLARSISKEGKVASAGKESIRDVSRYLNFPLYSNARVRIISMPLVEVGSFIEYKIKVYSSKLATDEDFYLLYRLREQYPVFRAHTRLVTPSDKNVQFKFYNGQYAGEHILAPQTAEEDGKKIYTWQHENVKPLIPEYSMPPIARVNPAVLISSFSSWDAIYRWWRGLYKNKLILEEDAQRLTRELIEGAVTDWEKAKRIYEFCARTIRYVAVEYGESGYEPHTAQEVFINRYGDCKDQSMLLCAMLHYAGLRAYPVLIPTRSTYAADENFPSIIFNHAIAAVELDGELVFMDPTAETTSFGDLPLGDQERTVMVFKEGAWSIIRTPQLTENETIFEMDIELDEDENAHIRRSVTTKGFFTAAHRGYLKYTHPQHIKDNIQQKMIEISPFSKLLEYSIEHADALDTSPVIRYSFTTEKFLNPARMLRIVPALDAMRIDYNLINKDSRLFPLDLEGIFTKRFRARISLPPNLEVKFIPLEVTVDNDWFAFSSLYETHDKEIVLIQTLEVKKRFIAVEEYSRFKKELEKVIYLLREEIILEKKNGTVDFES